MTDKPKIGAHLASLNLFRERDGTVEITVSGGSLEVMEEWRKAGEPGKPIDYIESLIVEAADRIRARSQPEQLQALASIPVK